MKSFFGYIRVSTVKQGEHGCSLDEQRASIETYAQKHGLRIVEWFAETETAAKQGRKEFGRLTAQLTAGKAAGVVIHKIDRGARNLKDWAGLGDLIDLGIDVRFAHEGLDMQTRGGRLAADIQAVVAADFIRNLRQEVRKGFYGRLKQGFYPLKAPRGYEDNGRAKAKTVHPIEGPLVRSAFDLYASGRYSLDLLRHELATRGLIQPNGKPLSFNGISKLLRNPFYIGLMRINASGEVFQGNHDPLVSKAVFDRVQAVLSGRLYPRVEVHRFRYRRLIKCDACGRSLTGERQKGRIYYRCHDRACPGVSVSENAVESSILHELASLRFSEAEMTDLRRLLDQEMAREGSARLEAEQRLERDIGAIDVRLSRLTDALIDGLVDRTTFDGKKAELLNRRTSLRERLKSDAGCQIWNDIAERFERGITAYSSYILATDDQKREAVEIFGSNLIVTGKKPSFIMHFPFNAFKICANDDDGEPIWRAVRIERLRKSIIHHYLVTNKDCHEVPQVPKSTDSSASRSKS